MKIIFSIHFAVFLQNASRKFSIILHAFYICRSMPLLTLPVLPWPRARYRPKTGTHHCQCIPPHGCLHSAIQNLSWCFPPAVCFVCRGSPVSAVSHITHPIKRTCKSFCTKAALCCEQRAVWYTLFNVRLPVPAPDGLRGPAVPWCGTYRSSSG